MKLASYRVRGRDSFGLVVGKDRNLGADLGADLGVVDLKLRLAPRYTSVLDLLRDDGLAAALAASLGVRADFPLSEVELLPPIDSPGKIL